MDKETLSHYGWIVIVSLVLAIMIALATPFGVFVGKAVSNTVRGFAGTAQTKFDGSDFDADQFELDYNKDKQEWEGTKSSAINREAGSVIPDGAKYTVKATNTMLEGNGTNKFPDTPATNDTYEEGDYVYTYNKGTQYGIQYGTEWSAVVKDKTKTEYEPLISEIAGKPLTNVCGAFYNCTSLITAPSIPSSVTDMSGAFDSCTSLTTAPDMSNANSITKMEYTFNACTSLTTAPTIPNSVTSMNCTFIGCESLATAPTIPSSVTNMQYTFADCKSLTGTIEINANPTEYYECFKNTQITGITGSCSQATKDALIATK